MAHCTCGNDSPGRVSCLMRFDMRMPAPPMHKGACANRVYHAVDDDDCAMSQTDQLVDRAAIQPFGNEQPKSPLKINGKCLRLLLDCLAPLAVMIFE
ncbi:hypothetical protein ACLKA6_012785 [Drosophila palustris]